MTEIKKITGGIATDDRGVLKFVNDFDFKNVKRFYQIINHEVGFIRAWHGHKLESKFFFVNEGSILLGAVNLENEVVSKFILTSNAPSVLYIPAGYANGFKSLTKSTIITVYSTSTLQESLNDDYRFPYDKWNIWDIEYR